MKLRSVFIHFILVLGMVFSHVTAAKSSKRTFIVLKLKTQKRQSLARLISKFVKPDSIIRKHTPMVKKIFKANPHIKNWKKIPKKSKIKLYISKNFLDQEKLDRYLEEKRKRRKFKKKAKKNKKNKKQKHFNLNTQFGVVNISGENDQTLKMNLYKIGLKYTHTLGKDLKYNIGFAGVKFNNITSSQADESVETKSLLPEFSLGISKKMSKKFSAELSYDLLNYFVVSQNSDEFVDISPKNVHRLSLKPYYILSSSFGTFGAVGYIAGDVSGFDISLGGNYLFGKAKSYSLALITYMSSLEVDGSKESSNAFIVSFGYGF